MTYDVLVAKDKEILRLNILISVIKEVAEAKRVRIAELEAQIEHEREVSQNHMNDSSYQIKELEEYICMVDRDREARGALLDVLRDKLETVRTQKWEAEDKLEAALERIKELEAK